MHNGEQMEMKMYRLFCPLTRLNLRFCIEIIKSLHLFHMSIKSINIQATTVNTSFILKPIPLENFFNALLLALSAVVFVPALMH